MEAIFDPKYECREAEEVLLLILQKHTHTHKKNLIGTFYRLLCLFSKLQKTPTLANTFFSSPTGFCAVVAASSSSKIQQFSKKLGTQMWKLL